MNIIEKELFNTKALKISGAESPFWYTSGTFGPFYINTHYLFGGEETAEKAMAFINEYQKDKYDFPAMMTRYVLDFYNSNKNFEKVVNHLIETLRANLTMDEVDYISGGERRDWFFSYIAAYILKKPHLTIYKNLVVIKSVNGNTERLFDGDGARVLHIADLITEGSSYFNYWIPALSKANMKMPWTYAVVDRQQGGAAKLAEKGIKVIAGMVFAKSFFEGAFKDGQMTQSQFDMIKRYMKSPSDFMREFVSTHPDFLRESIDGDEKTKERAIAFIRRTDEKG
ncbi:MAG: orotate phosphoribosyltransferase [Clostridia bacterium]|nr:orotate phosphoribosyltransferase [Clostridia bacterium]